MNGNSLSLSPREPSPPPPPTVWRVQVGEFGWLRAIHNGAPVLTAVESEAQQWSTKDAADVVLAKLPPSDVTQRVVQRRARP